MKAVAREIAVGLTFAAIGVVVSLAVDSLTPLQAITKLYELREKAGGKQG